MNRTVIFLISLCVSIAVMMAAANSSLYEVRQVLDIVRDPIVRVEMQLGVPFFAALWLSWPIATGLLAICLTLSLLPLTGRREQILITE